MSISFNGKDISKAIQMANEFERMKLNMNNLIQNMDLMRQYLSYVNGINGIETFEEWLEYEMNHRRMQAEVDAQCESISKVAKKTKAGAE